MSPAITYGERQAVSRHYPNVAKRSITQNMRATWGYRVECSACGDQEESTGGSVVSWEDGPKAWAEAHVCPKR